MAHQPAPAPAPAHVLIFPFPVQGHVNSMLKLAELLCMAGIHVSFVVSPPTHASLLRHSNIQSRFNRYHGFFTFETLPTGVYEGHLHASRLMDLSNSLTLVAKPFIRDLLVSGRHNRPPVTFVITDGVMSYAIDLAGELEIPIFYFRTISACAFWAYFCIPELIEAGEIPFEGKDLDVAITNVKGMEGFLRRRDLPSFLRVGDLGSDGIKIFRDETRQTPRTQGLILNTFEDLEGPILDQIRTHCPNIYPIGPLHAHLKTRLNIEKESPSTNSLREEDRSCLSWLDDQPPKSVLYVSFGSLAILQRHELMEFWHGLMNSGHRFLWVIRSDSIVGEDRIPAEVTTKGKGYMVAWAPQEEVLAHKAVGGFLTHSGWNSTLESIVEGVPMICWPYFADQQMNSRFVGEVWRVGLDMKDLCDRVVVERMVRDLMEERRDEFEERAGRTARMARTSVGQGGSSWFHLDRLIKDIRSIRVGQRE